MARSQQSRISSTYPLLLAGLFTLALFTAMAQAQTINVLHNFTGGADGAFPYAGLTMDKAGDFYGTASAGGGYNKMGVVFRLSRAGSGWVLTPLYSFAGEPNDGAAPFGGVIIGPDGSLYGMTNAGGQNDGGTVYRLRPSPTACGSFICPWQETVLYSFCPQRPCVDGAGPGFGNLVFDKAGNLYGTTASGGDGGMGVVFKLTPSGGGWTETVIYSFPSSCDNGCVPEGTPIFDSAGNLYGTTAQGGTENSGVVYELSPSGLGWTEQTLASVTIAPFDLTYGGLAMDGQGNLFGTSGGDEPGGAFELTPSNGGWTFSVMHTFLDNAGPYDTPTLDAAGNVYGTSCGEGTDNGSVFKLTPSNGGWIYNSVSFDYSNGECPVGSVVLDAAGNIYGTTDLGGPGKCGPGCGVIWEVTP